MGFLVPAGLALAALALPIVLFYMLKLRRQPARVSSLLLWQQVLQDRQANAPWQRLKRNLLLLLQLIILALLVMALARPYLSVQARVQGNVVLLLDASVSMQATDVAPSRFDAARRIALDLIERLEPDDAVTLIAVEQTPHILTPATTDRDRLRRALVAARASYGPADWQAALTLAAANAASLPEATVTIVSDGAFAAQGEAAAADFPPLAGPVGLSPSARAVPIRDWSPLPCETDWAVPNFLPGWPTPPRKRFAAGSKSGSMASSLRPGTWTFRLRVAPA
jgi:Ca-activated chloride channel homolog